MFLSGFVIGFTVCFLFVTLMFTDMLRPIFPDSIRRENEEQ